jgi:hypothetical protein
MNRLTPYWIATALLLGLVLAKFSLETGFTSLIRFGETWQERRHPALRGLPVATVPNSSGYDGQFYAQIALDPLLREPALRSAIDAPSYRARRILLPTAAALLGFGQTWWVLQAYALLNVACWLALGWLLYRQIDRTDPHAFARWIGCMFSMGALDSVRQSLVDLPALLLLVLAIDAHNRSSAQRSTLWLALANLTKETSLLGAAALHADPTQRPLPWRNAVPGLLFATLPLALWSFYVQQHWGGSSGTSGLGNFTWPLLGLLTQAKYSLRELAFGNFDARYSFSIAAIIGFAIQAFVLWRYRRPDSPWWRIGAAYSLLLLFLGSWVWSGYWAACRAVLPMTIAFNLLLPATRAFWPLWILGNLTLLHAVWRFL